MYTRNLLRPTSVLAAALLISSLLPAPASGSDVIIPCGQTLRRDFISERRLKMRVGNLGDCAAHIQAFTGRGQSGDTVVDLILLGGETAEVNFPGRRAGRTGLARSFQITAIGRGRVADLHQIPLLSNLSPAAAYWARVGDELRNANSGKVIIGPTGLQLMDDAPLKLKVIGMSTESDGGILGIAAYNAERDPVSPQLRFGAHLDGDFPHAWMQSADGYPLLINYLGNDVLIGNDSGQVGIGTMMPQAKLQVGEEGDQTRVLANAYDLLSSREHKTDIRPLDSSQYDAILKELAGLDVVRYRYKKESPDAPSRLGVIAEDAPEALTNAEGKALSLGDSVGYLLACVKAQQERIDRLEKEMKELRSGR